jgi:hypothetical protein
MQNILLYVESELDKQIIQNILIAAQYPIERMAIEVAGSKFNVIKFATNQAKSPVQNICGCRYDLRARSD